LHQYSGKNTYIELTTAYHIADKNSVKSKVKEKKTLMYKFKGLKYLKTKYFIPEIILCFRFVMMPF